MPRTKKLTDYTYSPTNPASEDAIRSQIDDAIQEVYDDSARSAGTVNTTGDQTIADIKTFTSSPIAPTPTTANQVSNKAYVDGVAISATIPLDSLTDDYLSSTPGNIKPRVATLETDFSTAQTDITNLQTATGLIETDIDIITTAVSDTGTVNNIVIATAGTFDLTKNKNVTPFIIPLFTNTNATVNIAVDGQANKLIKKANDTGTLVALEVGDIKKNVPIQLVWDSVSDFFIFAPKGGAKYFVATPKYAGNTSTTSMTQRLNVTGSGWIVGVHVNTSAVADGNWRVDLDGVNPMISTNKTTMSYQGSLLLLWRYNSGFQFYSAVSADYISISYIQDLGTKNIEKGLGTFRNATASATISATTQVLSVTGAGVLTGLSRQYTTSVGYDVVIDGVEVLTDVRVDHTMLLMFPFTTSLVIRCSSASDYVIAYQLI